MLTNLSRRFGIFLSTLIFTILSIIVSIVTTRIILNLKGIPFDRDTLIFASVAPALIAPLFSIINLRLLSHLDEARRLSQTYAVTDPLTQTYNRRHFFKLVSQAISNFPVSREAFSLAIIDLDNFKAINDQCGHTNGDRVLRRIAEIITGQIRGSDTLARFGGDEFTLLCLNTGQLNIGSISERIRKIIAETPIKIHDQLIRVTVSIGAVTQTGAYSDINDFLHQADQALFTAKENGGNSVVIS